MFAFAMSPMPACLSNKNESRRVASWLRFREVQRSAAFWATCSLLGSSSLARINSSRASSMLPFCRYLSAFSRRLATSDMEIGPIAGGEARSLYAGTAARATKTYKRQRDQSAIRDAGSGRQEAGVSDGSLL